MTPREFAIDFIFHWEDGQSHDPKVTHSLDPVDNGNWSGGASGLGKLVGSNHGVTAAALGARRHVPASTITRETMHALTINEAADIALALYFEKTHINALPWNRVTMSVFDMAWGAGASTAVKLLQRLIGVKDDGCPGQATADAVRAWIKRVGEDEAARAYGVARYDYYERIIVRRPANAKYRNGWRARTNYYLPGSSWWTRAA